MSYLLNMKRFELYGFSAIAVYGIMKYDKTCSVSGMFVSHNLMSFNEIWRKSM